MRLQAYFWLKNFMRQFPVVLCNLNVFCISFSNTDAYNGWESRKVEREGSAVLLLCLFPLHPCQKAGQMWACFSRDSHTFKSFPERGGRGTMVPHFHLHRDVETISEENDSPSDLPASRRLKRQRLCKTLGFLYGPVPRRVSSNAVCHWEEKTAVWVYISCTSLAKNWKE